MATIVSGTRQLHQIIHSVPTTVTSKLKEGKELTISPARVSLEETSPNTLNLKASVVGASPGAPERTMDSLVFVYGTLKRGFGNYWLMEEQLNAKHCRLVGTAKTKYKYPLVCGPFQVPFLLDVCGSGEHVRGELYQVNSTCLGLLDDLEGITKGHYVRCPVILNGVELDPSFEFSLTNGLNGLSTERHDKITSSISSLKEVQAEAYFAASHYTPGLCQAPHLEAYTKNESATYKRRKDRPQNRTFIEHVYHWIDERQKVLAGSR